MCSCLPTFFSSLPRDSGCHSAMDFSGNNWRERISELVKLIQQEEWAFQAGDLTNKDFSGPNAISRYLRMSLWPDSKPSGSSSPKDAMATGTDCALINGAINWK